MNEVTIFNNEEFGQIRTVMVDNELWFVGKDVAQCFGDTNYRRSLARLDEDDKGVTQIDTLGGKQNMTIINESGLYALLFYMQPQKAKGVSQNDTLINERISKLKRFKRWVTSEVLPTIRKTGTYSIQKKETLQGKELLALAVIEAQKVIEEQTMQIEEMKPKADYHDEVLNKKKLISTTIIAKDLGFTSAIMLNRYLHDKGIIYKSQSGIWCPYAKYEWLIEEGYADYQSCNIEGSLPTLKWTEKGRKWIVELLQKRAVL